MSQNRERSSKLAEWCCELGIVVTRKCQICGIELKITWGRASRRWCWHHPFNGCRAKPILFATLQAAFDAEKFVEGKSEKLTLA